MLNLSFENVLPLIISLGESDSEFDWDFDADNGCVNILQKDSNKECFG
jgi:hypothetical protein